MEEEKIITRTKRKLEDAPTMDSSYDYNNEEADVNEYCITFKEEPEFSIDDISSTGTETAIPHDININKKIRREKNYSAQEKLILMELAKDQKEIIENKKSDAATWRQKAETWEKLTELFNAKTGMQRQSKSLREKYDSMKSKKRLQLSKQNKSSELAKVSEKLASLLSETPSRPGKAFVNDAVENFMEENNSLVNSIELQHNAEDLAQDQSDWSECNLKSLLQPISKQLCVEKQMSHKRTFDEEQIQLILLQQQFQKDQNTRAQERHEQELINIKLKNELLQLELLEKKQKLGLKCNGTDKHF